MALPRWIAAFAIFCALSLAARAEIPLSGTFAATQDCPAVQSINRQTNPGNITLVPGTRYDLVAANKSPPSHYWVVVPGAEPERRWVAITCGTTNADVPQSTPTPSPSPAYRGTQYVLAVNWQPAFCETAAGKPECRTQHPDSFEASHFTLHGLWPQPRSREYCDVSERDMRASRDGRWADLPRLDLPDAQRHDLDLVMPGTRSGLDRHEWTKHGTCYSADPGEYFADSLDLLLALNTSPVADLFAGNIGRRITLDQVQQAFDAAFGPGAGRRVSMSCVQDGNRILAAELQINLTGNITGPDDFGPLMLAADPAGIKCRSGQVDAVGLK